MPWRSAKKPAILGVCQPGNDWPFAERRAAAVIASNRIPTDSLFALDADKSSASRPAVVTAMKPKNRGAQKRNVGWPITRPCSAVLYGFITALRWTGTTRRWVNKVEFVRFAESVRQRRGGSVALALTTVMQRARFAASFATNATGLSGVSGTTPRGFMPLSIISTHTSNANALA